MSRYLIVSFQIILMCILFAGCESGKLNLGQIQVNSSSQTLDKLVKERYVLHGTAAPVSDDLRNVVGLVLVVPKRTTTSQPTTRDFSIVSSNPSLRPADPSWLVVKPVSGQPLYEGKIDHQFQAGGNYTAFSADIKQSSVAEVVIKDDVFITYANPNDKVKGIPVEQLRSMTLDPKYDYYFIHSATLTTATYKIYDETSASSQLNGTVFAANGKVFVSNGGTSVDWLLCIEIFDVRFLRDNQGGTAVRPPLWHHDQSDQTATEVLKAWNAASVPNVQERLPNLTVSDLLKPQN